MNSAAHAPRLFHCPTVFMRDVLQAGTPVKIKSFKTLGGLAQHLEHGVCVGGREVLDRALEYVEERLRLLGLGHVKLVA